MAENIELAGITLDTSGVERGVDVSVSALNKLNSANQQTEAQWRKMRDTARQLATAHEQIAKRTAEARATLDSYMAKLSQEAETAGMTATQIASYRAKLMGATQAEAEHAAALARTIEMQKQSASSLNTLGGQFQRVATRALEYAAIYGAIRVGEDIIKGVVEQTMKDEQANARLTAVLRATGDAAGVTTQQLKDMAVAMSRSTLFNTQDIENAEAALLTFKNVQGDTFNQVLKLSADVAGEKGGDLVSWATKLGRALDDPRVGLTQLTRVGIQFSQQERDQIKTLLEHNELLKAQAIILDKINGKFGGVAETMHTGLSGAVHDFTNEWHQMLIALGETDPVQNKLGGFFEFIARSFRATADEMSNSQEAMRGSITRQVGLLEGQLTKGGFSPERIAGLRKAALAGSTPASPIMIGGQQFDFERYRDDLMVQKKLTDAASSTPAPKPAGVTHTDSEELIQYLDKLKEEKAELGMTAGQIAFYTAMQKGATTAEAAHAAALETAINASKKAAEAEKQRTTALASLMKRTQDEAAAAGLDAKQITLLAAARDGATQAQLKALGGELDHIQAVKDDAKFREEQARATDRQAKATTDYIAKLNEEIAVARGGPTDQRERDAALQGASPNQRAQIEQQEAYLAYVKQREKASQAAAKEDENYAKQFENAWKGALNGTVDAFGKFFTDGIEGKKDSFKQFTDGLLQTWVDMLVKMEEAALTKKILDLFLSMKSPTITPSQSLDGFGQVETAPTVPTKHGGGIVGAGGGVSRAMPMSVFMGAPRFHSGLMPDEFPAVLRRGEAVFTPEQMAAGAGNGGNGGQLVVHQEQHFHFQGIDGRSIQQMLHEQKGTIAGITAEAVRSSFAFRQQIQGQRS